VASQPINTFRGKSKVNLKKGEASGPPKRSFLVLVFNLRLVAVCIGHVLVDSCCDGKFLLDMSLAP
jgi:hypothetical protein